jgi:hypothetical protein
MPKEMASLRTIIQQNYRKEIEPFNTEAVENKSSATLFFSSNGRCHRRCEQPMWQSIFTHTASEQVAGRKLWKGKRNSTERGNLPTPNYLTGWQMAGKGASSGFQILTVVVREIVPKIFGLEYNTIWRQCLCAYFVNVLQNWITK